MLLSAFLSDFQKGTWLVSLCTVVHHNLIMIILNCSLENKVLNDFIYRCRRVHVSDNVGGIHKMGSWLVYSGHPQSSSDRYPQSTLDQYLINVLVDTWSTSQSNIGWESTNFRSYAIEYRSIHMSQLTLGSILTNTRSSVNHMSIEMLSKCWSRYRSSVDQRSINGISQHSTADAFSAHYPQNVY